MSGRSHSKRKFPLGYGSVGSLSIFQTIQFQRTECQNRIEKKKMKKKTHDNWNSEQNAQNRFHMVNGNMKIMCNHDVKFQAQNWTSGANYFSLVKLQLTLIYAACVISALSKITNVFTIITSTRLISFVGVCNSYTLVPLARSLSVHTKCFRLMFQKNKKRHSPKRAQQNSSRF